MCNCQTIGKTTETCGKLPTLDEFLRPETAVMEAFEKLVEPKHIQPLQTFLSGALEQHNSSEPGSIMRSLIKRLLDKIATCSTVAEFDSHVAEYDRRLRGLYDFSQTGRHRMYRWLSESIEGSHKVPPTVPPQSGSPNSWYTWYHYVVHAVNRLIEEYAVETAIDSPIFGEGSVIKELVQTLYSAVQTLESTKNPTAETIQTSVRTIWEKFVDIVRNRELKVISKFEKELSYYDNVLGPYWKEHDRRH